ncbi:MAG: type II toxin-antitoxin system RelE/ParE family toxin [Clostridiales bacterium]|nr:type II toxin-antitoxin system RelE/ParE family toxin [Clostridiales bacterium]
MTKDYPVIYSAAAKDDLRSIYRYIAYELAEPGIAKKQVDRIRNKIRKLGSFPAKHPSVDWEPWLSMGMHRVPVDNYLIFYLVNEELQQVIVTRIFYGGRDIEKEL